MKDTSSAKHSLRLFCQTVMIALSLLSCSVSLRAATCMTCSGDNGSGTVTLNLTASGRGIITFDLGARQLTATVSDNTWNEDVKAKLPASNKIKWFAQAAGSEPTTPYEPSYAVNGSLTGNSCPAISIRAFASWCSIQEEVGSCCYDVICTPEQCGYTPLCGDGQSDGNDEGEVKLIDDDDESNNMGESSETGPSSNDAGGGGGGGGGSGSGLTMRTKIEKYYRLGRVREGAKAGNLVGVVSFNYSAESTGGGMPPVPTTSLIDLTTFDNANPGLKHDRTFTGGRRQILSDDGLVDIEQLADGIRITCYTGDGLVIPSPEPDPVEPIEPIAANKISSTEITTHSQGLPEDSNPSVIHTWKGLQVVTRKPGEEDEIYELYSEPGGDDDGMWLEAQNGEAVRKVVNPPTTVGGVTTRMESSTNYRKDPTDDQWYPVSTRTDVYKKLVRNAGLSNETSVERLVESIVGSNGVQKKTYRFYEEDDDLLSHGNLLVQVNPDGSWTRYVYHGHQVAVLSSQQDDVKATYSGWLDDNGAALAAAATPADILAAVMAIPASQCRTEEVAYYTAPKRSVRRSFIKGVLLSTTTDTEFTVIDPFLGTRVREYRTVVQAPDGTILADTRRGVKATDPTGGEGWVENIYDIQTDGSRTTYEDVTTGAGETFQRTRYVTHGTIAQPAGVPGKTFRQVSVSDYENELSSQTQVFVGGESYATQTTTTHEKSDVDGVRIEKTFENGVEVSMTRYLTTGEVEETDVTGSRTISYTDPETGVSTVTNVGGGAVTYNSQTLFSGVDLVTVTSRHHRPAVGDVYPEGYLDRTTATANGVSRILSETEYDGLDRRVRATDQFGISSTFSYSRADNGTETVTETLPGNLTRITSYYQDGQIKSVTGTAVIPEYHQYAPLSGGKRSHTVSIGGEGSPRQMLSITDAAGREVRNERPGESGGASLIWTENTYNGLGQLVETRRSGGMAAQIYVYDNLGKLYRQGLDMNGNGTLDEASSDPINETVSRYEQTAGVWWQVQRTRIYEREEINGFRQSENRARMTSPISLVTESITPSGAKTVTTVVLDRANRKRTTTTVYPDSTVGSETIEIGGLTFFTTGRETNGLTFFNSYSDFRELKTIVRQGETSTYSYNSLGQLASESTATHHTVPEGVVRTTTYTYIPANQANAGKVHSKTAPYSLLSTGTSATYYEYDSQGRQTGEWGPGAYPVKLEFNSYGEKVKMFTYRTEAISAGSAPWTQGISPTLVSTTTWEYDAASGLLLSKKDAANHAVSYAYRPGTTLMENRTWARQVSGQPLSTNYGYDASGRQTLIDYSDATPDVTYAYRRDGSVVQVQDAAGQHVFSDWTQGGQAQRETISSHGSSLNLQAGLQRLQPRDGLGRRTGYRGQWNGTGVQLELPGAVWSYETTLGNWSQIVSGPMEIAWERSESTFPKVTTTRQLSGGGLAPLISTTQRSSARGIFAVAHNRTDYKQGRFRNNSSADSEKMTVHDTVFHVDPAFKVVPPVFPSPISPLNTSSRIYTTDTRGQILGARKKLDSASGTPYAPGLDVSYRYDDIGNRIEGGEGTAAQSDLSDLEETAYTGNALNQYTGISRPDALHITGFAPSGQGVTVNGQAATKLSYFYHKRLESSRSDDSLPAWMQVDVSATRTSPSPSLTAERSGHVYMPPIPEEPGYDADGNLTSDGRWDYAWDGENRLVQMTTRSAAVLAGVPPLRLSFAYDHLSRRIRKKVELLAGGNWALQSDLRFVYDGWNLVSEVQMRGDAEAAPNAGIEIGGNTVHMGYLLRSYVWGPDISETEGGAGGVGGLQALTRHERKGRAAESFWAAWDINGNVIGLASTTVADRAAVYEYDPFGKSIRVNEPEPDLNPVRFSSKYTDAETGLCYYGYRYYSAEHGRWISRDPIEEEGGLNLYGMVGNDPVNRVDYLGMYPPLVISALGSAYGGIARSKIAKSMGLKEAIELLTFVASSKDEEIGGLNSRASAGYDRYRGVFVLEPGGIDPFSAVHEATHAVEGRAVGSFASLREGHAHAMAHLYNSGLGAYRLLEQLRDEDFYEGAEVEQWNTFWEIYALGKPASTGRVAGEPFTFGMGAYQWVKLTLGAELSCKEIAKVMNEKFGSKHCVRFMCSTSVTASDGDYYTGGRRIYLQKELPEHFK